MCFKPKAFYLILDTEQVLPFLSAPHLDVFRTVRHLVSFP